MDPQYLKSRLSVVGICPRRGYKLENALQERSDPAATIREAWLGQCNFLRRRLPDWAYENAARAVYSVCCREGYNGWCPNTMYDRCHWKIALGLDGRVHVAISIVVRGLRPPNLCGIHGLCDQLSAPVAEMAVCQAVD